MKNQATFQQKTTQELPQVGRQKEFKFGVIDTTRILSHSTSVVRKSNMTTAIKHLCYFFKGFVIVAASLATAATAISGAYWTGHTIYRVLGFDPGAFDLGVSLLGGLGLGVVFFLCYLVGRDHEDRKLRRKVFHHHSSTTIGPKE